MITIANRQVILRRIKRSPRSGLWWLLPLVLFFWGGAGWVSGQTQAIPTSRYYGAFFDYYRGNYQSAVRDFQRGGATAFKIGNQRFLDSVCYWVMAGECYYHMGDYSQAIELYETALRLYLEYEAQNWQSRVQPPNVIQPGNNLAQQAGVTWGVPTRNAGYTNLPSVMQVQFGRLDAARAFNEGGRFNPAELRRVDVQEIMRCTALALHRRRVIKGPTCKYDPFTQELASKLGAAGNGPLFQAWNGVLSGIAKASTGDSELAASRLQSSLQLPGNLDHWLTPVALMEMAFIALETDQLQAAEKLALEATYCAAVFNQFDLVEEGLRVATNIHLVKNRTPYPPLAPAINWAARNDANLMQASAIVSLAECHAEAGDAESAARTLGQMRRATNRTSLGRAVVGSRAQYVNAVISFLNGNGDQGAAQLAEALQQFQTGSFWLYRYGLADKLLIDGSITPRQADQLFEILLHDPTAADWLSRPMESIAFLKSPHVGAMERWFDIKIAQKDVEAAVNVADLVRRHRFFADLPMGGRLLAFRWVLEGPEEALDGVATRQRTDLLTRFTAYADLARQAQAVREQLVALPVQPDPDSDELRQQTELFVELERISNLQETLMSSLALRREAAEMAFPPPLELSSFRDRIGSDQLALVSLATGSGYHVFLVGKDAERYLGAGDVRTVQRGLDELFDALGIQDVSGGIDEETLRDESWKQIAFELGQSLFGDATEADWEQYRELIIVPDGRLWYLPFEILPVGNDLASAKPLGERLKVRYSPTLALAFGGQRPPRTIQRAAIVAGRMHPRADAETSSRVAQDLQVALPKAARFEERMRIPSNLLGSILDQLVVLTDIKPPARGGIYALDPAQLDQGRRGSNLASWLSLPWAGPEHVILPGFTSEGAAGMKSRSTGMELFKTTCAMLAAGVRSISISRWRVGGQNSLEMATDYAVRMRSTDPLEAFHESVAAARKKELNAELEPRLKTKNLTQPLTAEHPFFSAANLLVVVPVEQNSRPPAEGDVVLPPAVDPGQALDMDGDGAGDPKDGGDDGTEDGIDGKMETVEEKESESGTSGAGKRNAEGKEGSGNEGKGSGSGEGPAKKGGGKPGNGDGKPGDGAPPGSGDGPG